MTFREQTQIRLPDHYSDNPSPVFVFHLLYVKEALSKLWRNVYEYVCVYNENVLMAAVAI